MLGAFEPFLPYDRLPLPEKVPGDWDDIPKAIISASMIFGRRSACGRSPRRFPSSSACPAKKPAVCHSLTELVDLYPTVARLCGLEVPARLQGHDISPMLDDPRYSVRTSAFSVAPSRKGFLLREDTWAYIQYE